MNANFMDWLINSSHMMSNKSLPIPLEQCLLTLILTTICLILGRLKLGFLICYGFLFYWGFFSNKLFLLDLFGGNAIGTLLYVFMGLFMSIVMFFGFFQETH